MNSKEYKTTYKVKNNSEVTVDKTDTIKDVVKKAVANDKTVKIVVSDKEKKDKYHLQKAYFKEHMKMVNGKYKADFVDDFREACIKTGKIQSQVFKKAMQEVIDDFTGNDIIRLKEEDIHKVLKQPCVDSQLMKCGIHEENWYYRAFYFDPLDNLVAIKKYGFLSIEQMAILEKQKEDKED